MSTTHDSSDLVRVLAAHAALPLQSERLAPVGQLLATWIKDANALSAKMSDPRYASVTPITGLLQVAYHGEVSNDH